MGTTSYHVCVDIKGFMYNHMKKRRSKQLSFFRDDQGQRYLTWSEAFDEMFKMLLEGKTGIPAAGCDHFDPMTGRCLGHRVDT